MKSLTDDEIAKLEAQQGQQDGIPPSGPLTDEQIAELENKYGAGPLNNEVGVFRKALNWGLEKLATPGSVTRHGIAKGIEALGGPEITKPGDYEKAWEGQGPTTKDYLLRADVPDSAPLSEYFPGAYSDTGEGWALQKGGALDLTALSPVGLVGDVATDPLTLVSGVASRAAQAANAGKVARVINRVVNPLEAFTSGGGEAIYKSGVKNIDTRMVEKGMEPVSPYLFKEGIWGGPKGLQEGMKRRMEELAAKRANLYSEIEGKGITIDPTYASQEARDLVAKIKENPYMKPKAEKAEEFLDLATDPMSVQQASDVKTALYNSLPAEAFNPDGSLSDIGKQMMRSLSSGYKTEIEKAAEFGRKGAGQELTDINAEWGAYLNAQKPAKTEIAKGERKNLLTQVKAAVIKHDPAMAAAMYGGQALNSGAVRTGAGLALDRTLGPIGRTLEQNAPGLIDPVLRNLLWGDVQKQRSEP